MKLRYGFVSNSSSSSFLISTDAKHPLKFSITQEVDLSDKVTDTLRTVEDIVYYMDEKYKYQRQRNGFDWRKYEDSIELFERLKAELEQGKELHIVYLPNGSTEANFISNDVFVDCECLDRENEQ